MLCHQNATHGYRSTQHQSCIDESSVFHVILSLETVCQGLFTIVNYVYQVIKRLSQLIERIASSFSSSKTRRINSHLYSYCSHIRKQNQQFNQCH